MIKSMAAISLWQPYASLVSGSFKSYETRSWQCSRNLIGSLIAIHAAKRWTRDEQRYTERFIREYPETAPYLRPEGYQKPPLGVILCVCRLLGCFKSDSLNSLVSDRERAFGDWSPGRYVWKLEVVKVPPAPIPCRGMQGIWRWEYELPTAAP